MRGRTAIIAVLFVRKVLIVMHREVRSIDHHHVVFVIGSSIVVPLVLRETITAPSISVCHYILF